MLPLDLSEALIESSTKFYVVILFNLIGPSYYLLDSNPGCILSNGLLISWSNLPSALIKEFSWLKLECMTASSMEHSLFPSEVYRAFDKMSFSCSFIIFSNDEKT